MCIFYAKVIYTYGINCGRLLNNPTAIIKIVYYPKHLFNAYVGIEVINWLYLPTNTL